uniref:Condensin complex subunit 1 C-terminal domain-containing protein n=1 Tax=Hemiselmis andersenii TaxID=464988 RepID=A0A6T8M3R4_HEMAN|mmetsp:Transcript_31246/g.72804  ORF Transcript_31246/g.72804 Transcript_31246/m.72804 type:complete len:208 (+) Transcript_31246:2-625(+)
MESDNWRFRHLLAVQLGDLFSLFSDETVETELYPIFVKLLRDPVAEVRNGAAQQLGQILKRLKETNAPWRDEFVSELSEFASDDCFQVRLTYAFMCNHLVKLEESLFDGEVFEKDFLPQLVQLSSDKVTNIRRLVANCVTLLREKKGFGSQPDVKECVEVLQNDKDIDVLRTMGKNLELGITGWRHNGVSSGAERDQEVRGKLAAAS